MPKKPRPPVPGSVNVSFHPDKVTRRVMQARGFPNGLSLEKYPTETHCEAVSPGIGNAQRRALRASSSNFRAEATFNSRGRMKLTIYIPEGMDVRVRRTK